MKKEKTIKTYQRRTKSGKVVTVKQHTAKYDAADKAKEMATKKGAGDELAAKKGMPDHNLPMNEYLEELKKLRKGETPETLDEVSKEDTKTQEKEAKTLNKKVASLEKKLRDLKYAHSGLKRNDPKKLKYAKKIQELQADLIATKKASAHQDKIAYSDTKKSSPSVEEKSKSVKSTKSTKNAATTQANGVSASDFKSWYHFNDWDKPKKSWPAEVRAADAAIRKQLGSKKAYDDYCAQIDGSYSKSGHNKAFKSFGGGVETSTSSKSSPKIKSEKISKVSDTPYSTAIKKKWNATYLKAAAKANIDEATLNRIAQVQDSLVDSEARLFTGKGSKKTYSEAKKSEKALYSSLTDSQKAFYRKYFDYDVSKATKSAESKADAIMGKKSNEAKTAKTGAVTWTTWKTQMQNKYQGQGKNAEILSLLGINHSMRLSPSGYTKGALTTAIKELRKQNSPTSAKNNIKRLEKLLEQKNVEKGKKISSAKKPTTSAELKSVGKSSTKASSTASTTGAGEDWSKATVDKIGREYGGGYTIVGTPNDRLWSSTNFRTKSQALDFIKRKQKESS